MDKPKGRFRERLDRAGQFLTDDIWDLTPRTRVGRAVVHSLRTALLVVKGFRKDNLFMLSAALTFKVIFAIVPMIAVTLAVLKGFGGMEGVVTRLKGFLISTLARGTGEEVARELDALVAQVDATAIGLVGFAILIWTAFSLLIGVEKAFNQIWGVAQPRPILRRLTIYWTMLTLAPLAAALSLTMATFLQNQTLYLWLSDHVPFFSKTVLTVTPYVFGWAVFTLIYLIMPNTRVRFVPALVGAVIAGTSLEIMKDLYFWYNTHVVTTYHVYGSLGAIPVFLLWIYISWCITLFGAEIAFAVQNVKTYRREIAVEKVSPEFKERAGLAVMMSVVKAFVDGAPPPTTQALAERFNAPVRLINDLVAQLTSKGLLREVVTDTRSSGGLVPGCDPSSIAAAAVIDAIHSHGTTPSELPESDVLRIVRAVMKNRWDRLHEVDGTTNLRYLIVNGGMVDIPERSAK